jgi:hypothetical protein
MFNYNREVYEAEIYRADKMHTAANRQVPFELRSRTAKRVRSWLSREVIQPVLAGLAVFTALGASRTARTWRRVSTRVIGFVVNVYREIAELVPG